MKRKIKNNYSISKVLRQQNRSNEAFEIQLNNLTLEELIALKLELGYKSIGFPLYGFPLWRSLNYIIRDGILKYSLSSAGSINGASRLLGLEKQKMYKLLKKYKIKNFFSEINKNDN